MSLIELVNTSVSDAWASFQALPDVQRYITIVSAFIFFVWITSGPQKGRPGPDQFIFLGNLVGIVRRLDRLTEFTIEAFELFGKCAYLKIPGLNAVQITDPADVEYVLKGNFDNYIKGPEFTSRLGDLLGKGIFASDGGHWSVQRKKASFMFKVSSLRDVMLPVFKRHSSKFVRKISPAAGKGEPIDIFDFLNRFTLDSIGEIAFGVDVNSLEQEEVPFSRAFDTCQYEGQKRFLNPLWRLCKLLKLPNERRIEHSLEILNDFASEVITTRKSDPQLDSRTDMLSEAIKNGIKEGEPCTESELRDLILNFLIAGRDTTAQALSWTLYELSQNPHVVEKIQKEIDEVFGHHECDYDALTVETPYIEAVCQEALRMHPSVPKDVKFAVNEDTLPSGYPVDKGMAVMYCPYAMGRIGWPEPDTFKPERWLDPDFKRPTAYELPVFNAGPRLCLGNKMALLEMKTLLVTVCRSYNLHLLPGKVVRPLESLTNPIADGLPMTVEKRKV